MARSAYNRVPTDNTQPLYFSPAWFQRISLVLFITISTSPLLGNSESGFFVFAASGWTLTLFLITFFAIFILLQRKKNAKDTGGPLSDAAVPVHPGTDSTLINHMLDGLVATCEDRIDYMNPAAIRILGLESAEHFSGKDFFDFVVESERPLVREFFHRVEDASDGGEIEARILSPDNKIIHAILHTVLVPTDRCSRYCVTTIKNITLRRKLEIELRESEMMHREIIDTTQEGYILLNRDFQIMDFNRALVDMTGYEGSWLEKRSVMDLSDRGSVMDLSRKLRNLEKSGHESFDTVFLKNGGEPMYLRVSASILPDSEQTNVIFLFLTDLTAHRQALDALKLQEHHIRQLKDRNEMILQSAGEGIFGLDRDGRVAFANQAALNMLQLDADEFLDRGHHELIHHSRADGTPFPLDECAIQKVLVGKEAARVEEDLFWRKDGNSIPVEYTVSPIEESGNIMGAVIVFRDISARKESEREQKLTRALFETTAEAMMITDREMRILSINPAFTRVTGFVERDVIGKDPRILKSGRHPPDFYQDMWEDLLFNGHWKGEIWNRRKNGELYVQRLTISAIRDNDNRVTNFVSVFSDITEEKKEEEETEYRATHDALTGLPNRTLLMDRLHGSITLAHRKAEAVAVFFLDLDGFKPVNDNYGHIMGDLLLQEVAKRLQFQIRESDTIARHGGDEFVVVAEVEKDRSKEHAIQICSRIQGVFQTDFTIDDRVFQVGCSIGIALYPDHGKDSPILLDLADRAMYEVKRGAKENCYIYDPLDLEVSQRASDEPG